MVQHGAVQTHGHWALYNQLDLGPRPGSSSCVTVGKGFTTYLSSPPPQSLPPPPHTQELLVGRKTAVENDNRQAIFGLIVRAMWRRGGKHWFGSIRHVV